MEEKEIVKEPTAKDLRDAKKHMRAQAREGKKIIALLKKCKTHPGIRIPENVFNFVTSNAQKQAEATKGYLTFERNIGFYKFRQTVLLSDKELEESIAKQQGTICNIVYDYETMLAWITLRGLMADYQAFLNQLDFQRKEAKDKKSAEGKAVPLKANMADIGKFADRRRAMELFK